MTYCDNCGEKVYEETKYMHWLTLMNFINFLHDENYITTATRDAMIDSLMSFKPYAFEGEEDNT